MQTDSVANFCVYTIHDGKELKQIAKRGGSCSFEERKAWVAADRLFHEARSTKQSLPVLLADAADCSRLLFWGFLIDLDVQNGRTRYGLDQLRRVRGEHTPQELILRSSGKSIASNFIRPYAICRTPFFLGYK